MVAPIFGQPLPNAQWPMGGHDARHTGRQTFTPAQGGTPGLVKWTFATGFPNLELQSSCAVDGSGTIIFTGDPAGTTECPLFAVQVQGGVPTLLWRYRFDPDHIQPAGTYGQPALGWMQSPPPPGFEQGDSLNWGVAPYHIYWGDFAGRLRCVDSLGHLAWRSAALEGEVNYGPVIGQNGHVYVTTAATQGGTSYLYCFNQSGSGLNVQWLWRMELDSPGIAPPGLYEQVVHGVPVVHVVCVTQGVWPGQDPALYKVLDQTSGYQIEASTMISNIADHPVQVWPIIGDDGTVYVGTFGILNTDSNYVVAFNIADLSFKWTGLPNWRIEFAQPLNQPPPPQGTFGAIEGSPCLGNDGTVFFGTQETHVGSWAPLALMLKVTDQGATPIAEVFHTSYGARFDPIPSFCIKSTDGSTCLLFASEDTYVYAADPATGTLLPGWPGYIGPIFLDHPNLVIMSDVTVLVGMDNGVLYGLWGPN